jgi:glucose 1-dehydrogenase
MKAVAVWPERHRVEVEERVPPALVSDSSLRLRMLDVGVCGTDAEICRFDYGGTPPPGEDHLVVGHEGLARVVEGRRRRLGAPPRGSRRPDGAPPVR